MTTRWRRLAFPVFYVDESQLCLRLHRFSFVSSLQLPSSNANSKELGTVYEALLPEVWMRVGSGRPRKVCDR